MTTWISIGLALGALAGIVHTYSLLHAPHLQNWFKNDTTSPISVAVWTIGLWTLFGTYILSLWVLATALYAGVRVFRQFQHSTR